VGGATVTTGVGLTVIVAEAVLVHPLASVPVTVYEVVDAGETVILVVVAPVFHEYVTAPPALSVALCPEQIDVEGETVTTGSGFTFTVAVAVLIQPFPSVPVTVYVVFPPGETVTLEPDKAPGCHVYVTAPPAVNVVELPVHMVDVGGAAVTVGNGFTVTVTVAWLLHPPGSVPTTVYVCVLAGFAVTLVPVVALSPIFGAHVYVDAPPAVNTVEPPEQIDVEGETVVTGGLEGGITAVAW